MASWRDSSGSWCGWWERWCRRPHARSRSRLRLRPTRRRRRYTTTSGIYHYAITTASPDAQKYFDQGLTLSYAFNHAEAIRAFRAGGGARSQVRDVLLGHRVRARPEHQRADHRGGGEGGVEGDRPGARSGRGGATEKERAYIDALAKRYRADPKAERPPLDRAYAEAMRGGGEALSRRPRRRDALRAVADGHRRRGTTGTRTASRAPFTNDVLPVARVGADAQARSRRRDPSLHPRGRSVAESRTCVGVRRSARARWCPARDISCTCRRTSTCAPAATTTRRWRTSDAIKADEAYFKGDAVPGNMTYQVGYYPHNIHFFVASASMEGRRADALKAAEEVRAKMHADMLRDPAMGGMVQHMHLTPLYTKVRFGMWDAVLAEPAPPDDLPFMSAMWHVARGLGACRAGARPGSGDGACGGRGGQGRSGAQDDRHFERQHRRGDRRDRSRGARRRNRNQAAPRRSGGAPLHAGRRARGRPHLHGTARLAGTRATAAGRGAPRARTRERGRDGVSRPT